MPTYEELHLGSSRVPICLHNLDAHAMEIPTKAVVGEVVPVNQVPLVVHPTRTTEESKKPQKGWVLDALDLQGLKECPESDQKQAMELLFKWEHLFAHSNLDLGKTALIKQKIQLTDWSLLKSVTDVYPLICTTTWGPISRKCWILVLSISHTVCWQAQSSWPRRRTAAWGSVLASGSWTTGLWRMHTHCPRLMRLLIACRALSEFSSLNLKSGYWQVEMDKESKPLTVFMVGLLGFYECKGCLSGSPMTLQPSRDYGDLPWGPQSPLVYHLSGWYSHLLQGSGQPPWEAQSCVMEIGGDRT